jgi:manganese-dependent ADP-ribose/CDP-alcohol diphosphatase
MGRVFKSSFIITLLLSANVVFAQLKEKPLFTFGILADVQYADQDNAGTRYYRLSPKKLAEAVDSFNQQKPAFVLSLGDYIDKNFGSYDTLNPITARLTMHLYHTLGNHEFAVNDNEKEKVLQKENLQKPYYSFEKNNWRFVIINGNDVSLQAYSKGSTGYKDAEALLQKLKADSLRQAQTWNGAVGKEQLAWLEKELAAAQKQKQKVVMACHFPLYPHGATELLWNAKEVRALIEQYSCVFAYFNGHVHKSQYFFEKGVHYISFRGMVELEDNAFSLVTAYTNRLEIKGFGKEVNRTLK